MPVHTRIDRILFFRPKPETTAELQADLRWNGRRRFSSLEAERPPHARPIIGSKPLEPSGSRKERQPCQGLFAFGHRQCRGRLTTPSRPLSPRAGNGSSCPISHFACVGSAALSASCVSPSTLPAGVPSLTTTSSLHRPPDRRNRISGLPPEKGHSSREASSGVLT